MRKITKREKIKGVARAWKKQYSTKIKRDIYNALVKIDLSKATEEDIAKIIENNSWTQLICDECGRDCEKVIQLGEEPDYDSVTVFVCEECLKKALELIKEA